MAKLSESGGRRKESKHDNRFYTKLDMAEIKHYEAIMNSMKKRGVLVPEGQNHIIVLCGCGREGCFVHRYIKSEPTQADKDWFFKNYPHNHHKKLPHNHKKKKK